jgi:beta-lactamase class A
VARWTPHRRSVLAAAAALVAGPGSADSGHALFADYERQTDGRVGLYARNLETGRRLSWRADERFVMCNSFKASLAALVLKRVDAGHENLEAMIPYGGGDLLDYAPVAKENLAKGAMSVAQMCAAAVESSDNTCANLLLARVGGPPALTDFWRSIGDTVTRLDHNEPLLNRSAPGDPHDTTTPAAMAVNLRGIILGDVLSPASRDRLTGWMVACKTGDNRLRGGLPKGWKVADKTGNNAKDAAADIAVVWPRPDQAVLVCAYTQGGSPTPERLTAIFGDIGRLVGQRLG